MASKNLLYITNIPSPYRVKYFNVLSNYYNLTVIYERSSADDRDVDWKEVSNNKYKCIFLKGIKHKNDSIISSGIKKHLKKYRYHFIVFCNFSTLAGIIGINYCVRHNIHYFIESDGAFYEEKRLKDYIKRKMLKNALCCLSTCESLDEYYIKLGVDKKKIMRYRFTSLTIDDYVSNSTKPIDKGLIKNQLGIHGKKTLLFVGQFIHRKGIDIFLRAAALLPKNLDILIVGGEPTKEYLRLVKRYNLVNVHFFPFKKKNELSSYYKSADVFVLPTREDIWGLVVNEALSYGLPVITTKRCNAGLELIKDGYNGWIINHDSVNELLDAINKILSIDQSFSNNCTFSIKEYTIENMVKDHIKLFHKYE